MATGVDKNAVTLEVSDSLSEGSSPRPGTPGTPRKDGPASPAQFPPLSKSLTKQEQRILENNAKQKAKEARLKQEKDRRVCNVLVICLGHTLYCYFSGAWMFSGRNASAL